MSDGRGRSAETKVRGALLAARVIVQIHTRWEYAGMDLGFKFVMSK